MDKVGRIEFHKAPPLYDEIDRLRAENASLKEQVERLQDEIKALKQAPQPVDPAVQS